MYQQLSLLPDLVADTKKQNRSGTFVDNMKLPIHRWFRYSAGFSAAWVEQVLKDSSDRPEDLLVLDPFAGSGTTLLACDKLQIPSVGVEAHPFISRIAQFKLLWGTSPVHLFNKINQILEIFQNLEIGKLEYPDLIHRCFSEEVLHKLDRLRRAWLEANDDGAESQLAWLILTSILRPSSSAGTAQWQYILPERDKKRIVEPIAAFQRQAEQMISDMKLWQTHFEGSSAQLIKGDARGCPQIRTDSVDLVITSPPYANNYDYADVARFEMSFWGEVSSWGDLHGKVRQYLIRSSSQHASKDKLQLDTLLTHSTLLPIQSELTEACHKLEKERLNHGGKKHYHTMVAAYFIDMAQVWLELRRVCKKERSKLCFVIGDSAPYGIYIPVDRWLGELAVASGFHSYTFEKLRDRNTKWKNRKHRVPLHEGRLWVD